MSLCNKENSDKGKQQESLFMKELSKRGSKDSSNENNKSSEGESASASNNTFNAKDTIDQLDQLLQSDDIAKPTSPSFDWVEENQKKRAMEPGYEDKRRMTDPNNRRATPIPGDKEREAEEREEEENGGYNPWDSVRPPNFTNEDYDNYNRERKYKREDYPEMSDEEWEKVQKKQEKLDDEGLGGLIPRTIELLKFGASFSLVANLPLIIFSILLVVFLNARGFSFYQIGKEGMERPVPEEIAMESNEERKARIQQQIMSMREQLDAQKGLKGGDEMYTGRGF